MPDSDGAALHRAILDNPADDVVRLIYADWLDESGISAARAEFIRVQCELARIPPVQLSTACPGCGYDPADGYHHNRPDCPVLRSDELLTADRRCEWAWVPWANGDAFGPNPFWLHGQHNPGQANPHFRRGFVEVVKVPALAWLFERRYQGHAAGLPVQPGDVLNPTEWRVTPWALAVVSAHPVTEFEIGDREPWLQQENYVWWGWIDGQYAHEVPQELVSLMIESGATYSNGSGAVYFKTREAALRALAQAAGRLVRRVAGYAE